MMVCPEGGNAREAVTFYKTGETFLNRFALMELHPATGRTHQLRIHMLHIGTPIVADKLYMGQSSFCKSQVLGDGKTDGAVSSSAGSDEDVLIARQALHAYRLTIRHPVSGKEVQFEAPFPPDFERTLHWLRSVG
ncbi:MAG: RluA family pseudouridine synthase, partial [Verrucomicrobiae bacterium]|nr:RluA family pseudouridine synthase [Verrucomicrobiae bacterium]